MQKLQIAYTLDTPLVSFEQVPCKSRALEAKMGLLSTRDMKSKGPRPTDTTSPSIQYADIACTPDTPMVSDLF